MKLRTISIIGGAALLSVVGMASFASAAVAPEVTLTIRNSSNTVITNALVGTSVHARAQVASSSTTTAPTGSVNFNLYSGNQTCSGSPLVQTNVTLVDGIAESQGVSVPLGGLSYKVHYNGQSDVYTEVDSACIAISANQFSPSLSLSLSNNSVQAGSFVYAIPNLTGESSGADGSIVYKVYTNNTCSDLALDAGSKSVTNGSTQNSDAFQFITPDTYYWQGVYSGDDDNAIATSSCTGAVLTVVATSTPNPPQTGPGTISGTVFNDKNKNGKQDSGEQGLSGFKVWLRTLSTTTDKGWWWKGKHKRFYRAPIVQTVTTDSNGNYSFSNLVSGTYFVEQEEPKGWDQRSSDRRVVLSNTNSSADVDFANVEKKNKDKKNKGGKKDNGNHYGWWKGWGNIWKNR